MEAFFRLPAGPDRILKLSVAAQTVSSKQIMARHSPPEAHQPTPGTPLVYVFHVCDSICAALWHKLQVEKGRQAFFNLILLFRRR